MPFTLDNLASALRGIPRDAMMLVRLPDGTLRQIVRLQGTKVNAEAAEGKAPNIDNSASVGRYAIVIVLANGD